MAVVNANAIPMFVRLLEVPTAEVREQALWLANISGENAELRDLLISHGAIELVIAQFTTNPVRRNFVSSFASLLRLRLSFILTS